MESSHLSIRNISKSFGNTKVLKNVSLEIRKGELFSLLGPSGCGKTTLLRIIGGFETPDDGEIFLDGVNILDLPPDQRHVNTIFQSYALFPHLTVYDNVAFALRLKKLPEDRIEAEVNQYLNLVRLDRHKDKKPIQLSGGQKQRVAIARALINKPTVLLLDEPLAALDAKLRQHMLIELDGIHDDIGITFIYVTHDQQEALSVSDRISVLNEGVSLQVGTPAEIYESPVNSFIADFIGETNFLEGKVISKKDNFGTADCEGLGEVVFDMDKPVEIGQTVKLTVRPEKIRITRGIPQPDLCSGGMNVIKGIVDEVIYSGFQSKFFVKLEGRKQLFKVFKQHVQFYADDIPIKWKDTVYLWWNPNDGYLVEVMQD